MALREDLELDLAGALRQIDSLGAALGQVAGRFRGDLAAALDVLGAGASVEIDADTTGVADEVSGAVDAADSRVVVDTDTTGVTGDITGAVDAADTGIGVEVTNAAELSGQITGAVDAADTSVAVEVEGLGAVSSELGSVLDAADTATDAIDGLGLSTRALGVAAASVGFGAIIAGAQQVVDVASDLEESGSKVEAVFGDASDTIFEFADTAATSVGLANDQALEFAGTFGNLFTALGLTRTAAADLAPEIVQLGADLASFNNLAVSDALEKLRSGLVGEIEPLRSLGVSFNAAQVEAKALELGLGDVNGEVDEAAKVQGRYALIVEQTTAAQGDFARTSDGLANQQRALAAEFRNAQAELGQALLPLAKELVTLLREDGIPTFSRLAESLLPLLVEAFEALSPALGVTTDLLVAVTPVLDVFVGLVEAVPDELLTVGAGLLAVNRFLPVLTGGLGRLGGALSGSVIPGLGRASGALTATATGAQGLATVLPQLAGVGAVAVGVGLFGKAIADLIDPGVQADVDGLTRSLLDLADSGDAVGETARVFGDDLEIIGVRISDAFRGVDTGAFDALDEALTALAQRDPNAAAAAFSEIAQASIDAGTGIDDLKVLLPGFSQFLADAALNAQLLGRELGGAAPTLIEFVGALGGSQAAETFAEALVALGDGASAVGDAVPSIDEFADAQIRAETQVGLASDAFLEGVDSAEEYRRLVDLTGLSLEDLADLQRATNEEIANFASGIVDVSSVVSDAFQAADEQRRQRSTTRTGAVRTDLSGDLARIRADADAQIADIEAKADRVSQVVTSAAEGADADVVASAKARSDAVQALAREQADAVRESAEEQADALTSAADDTVAAIETATDEGSVSLQGFVDAFEASATDIAEFAADLRELVERGAVELASALAEQGIAASDATAEAVALGDDALGDLEEQVSSTNQLLAGALADVEAAARGGLSTTEEVVNRLGLLDVPNPFAGLPAEVSGSFDDLVREVEAGLSDTEFAQLGTDTGNALIDGLADAIRDRRETRLAAELFETTEQVKTTFTGELNIFSPSRFTRDIGRNLIEGLALGLGETDALDVALRGATAMIEAGFGTAAFGAGPVAPNVNVTVPAPTGAAGLTTGDITVVSPGPEQAGTALVAALRAEAFMRGRG